jgi:protein-arginine kinase activator protein McsA
MTNDMAPDGMDDDSDNDRSNMGMSESELNEKLDSYIKLEKFEEAAKLRDYMSKNSIKRKNNNL